MEEPGCAICFGPSGAPGGALVGCGHRFCLACIRGWSQIENTCPLCKQRFGAIEVRGEAGRRLLSVSTATQRSAASEENCYACGRGDAPERTFVCECCEVRVCHMRCLRPPLREVPAEAWYCNFCVESGRARATLPLADLGRKQRLQRRRSVKELQANHLRRLRAYATPRRREISLRAFGARLKALQPFRALCGDLGAALRGAFPKTRTRP